jgi:hypothetical protein
MRMLRALALLCVLAPPGVAFTQSAPAPTSQSPAQQPSKTDGIPPCPTFAEQNAALGKATGSGTEAPAAQPAERSGVLPSAGGAGLDKSEAPTVGMHGQEVRSPLDCPLVPDHPNAIPPGTIKNLPTLSK